MDLWGANSYKLQQSAGRKKRGISLSEGGSFLPVLSQGLSGQGERQDNTLKEDAIGSTAPK